MKLTVREIKNVMDVSRQVGVVFDLHAHIGPPRTVYLPEQDATILKKYLGRDDLEGALLPGYAHDAADDFVFRIVNEGQDWLLAGCRTLPVSMTERARMRAELMHDAEASRVEAALTLVSATLTGQPDTAEAVRELAPDTVLLPDGEQVPVTVHCLDRAVTNETFVIVEMAMERVVMLLQRPLHWGLPWQLLQIHG